MGEQNHKIEKLFSGTKKIKLIKHTNGELAKSFDGLNHWKVLIVDDEKAIHTVTRLALDGFVFQNKKMMFLDAHSGEEAKQVLEEHPDIAVILLDVVMETNRAGLDLVKYIREVIRNDFVRIILRTGQPGQAPERDVIRDYAIDDYKTKTELTQDKLYTVLLASMRTYEAMQNLENYRQTLEEKVKERTLALEEANATKDKFFSIIAHDIKNPLGVMIGFSDMLLEFFEEMSPDDMKKSLKGINQSSKQLLKLLENLLNWSRSQIGKIKFSPEKIDISLLVMTTIVLLNDSAHAKNITIRSKIPQKTTVYADKEMINTVIRNLLSNAIKFTPEGGKITFKSHNFDGFCEISLTDTGVGICPKRIKKLFHIESTDTTLGTNEEKGTGLGLILCKEFIEKNGGEIWIESELGKGSSFRFTIPQDQHVFTQQNR